MRLTAGAHPHVSAALDIESDEMPDEIRWHHRFKNFSRAFSLLREALEEEGQALNQLEREGVIQRFEYTFELAWNLLKDRLEHTVGQSCRLGY